MQPNPRGGRLTDTYWVSTERGRDTVMTRNELIRLRRQMQRRIRDVVEERRVMANQRAASTPEAEASQVRAA